METHHRRYHPPAKRTHTNRTKEKSGIPGSRPPPTMLSRKKRRLAVSEVGTNTAPIGVAALLNAMSATSSDQGVNLEVFGETK